MYKVFIDNAPLYFCTEAQSRALPKGVKQLRRKELDSPKKALDVLAKEAKQQSAGWWVKAGKNHQTFEHVRSTLREIPAAGGAVRNEKGELLFIFRRGHWDLPKGKIEKGEGIPVAATREVEEECGLNDVRIVAPLETTYHIYRYKGDWAIKPTYWFLMEQHCDALPVPQEEEDITKVAWLSAKAFAKASPTFPNIVLVAEEAFQRPM